MARSNRLLAVGAVVTLLGAVLVLAVLMLQGDSSPQATQEPPPAPPTATSAALADGDTAAVVAAQLDLADDVEAVAVTVDFQGSVAGLPAPGDRVHVYGLPRPGEDGEAPVIERLLDDVEVLAVTGASHDSNSGSPTVVLAVPDGDVAEMLTAHGSQSVHLSLVEGGRGLDDGDADTTADDTDGDDSDDGSQAADG